MVRGEAMNSELSVAKSFIFKPFDDLCVLFCNFLNKFGSANIFCSTLLIKLLASIFIRGSVILPAGYFSLFGLCFSSVTSIPFTGKEYMKFFMKLESWACNSKIFSFVRIISSFLLSSSEPPSL